MALLRLLEDRFDFIFVDAPIESEPGPHVLPVFENEGPYYCWLGVEDAPQDLPGSDEVDSKMLLLDKLEESHGHVVGILGFSQGAAVGLELLFRDQRRREMALPSVGYCFGAFVGGYSLPLLLHESNSSSGASTPLDSETTGPFIANLQIPTIHAIGSRDLFAKPDKGFRDWVENQPSAASFSFEGGHEMPRRTEDVLYLANEILRMFEKRLRI